MHSLQKSMNALQQVVARGGHPIIICDEMVQVGQLPRNCHLITVPRAIAIISFYIHFSFIRVARRVSMAIDRPLCRRRSTACRT